MFGFEPVHASLEAPSGDPYLIEGIPRHFEPLFGEVAVVYHEKTSECIHLDLFEFDPWAKKGNFYTLVTGGMASRPMNVPSGVRNRTKYRYAEILLHLPDTWPMDWDNLQKPENFWPIAALKSFARLPHERESWVWGGHTLQNGEFERYAPETDLCAALLCPSFQLPDEFQVLSVEDGRELVFLTLAFLYREELEFTWANGSDGLFERAQTAGLSPMEFFVLDTQRANLCR